MWRDVNAVLPRGDERVADVCLIAEGCYPYVAGGVSTWIDWLIRAHPELTFTVLAILPAAPDSAPRYARPDNLLAIHHVRLDDNSLGTVRAWPAVSPERMAELLGHLLNEGDMAELAELMTLLGPVGHRAA